MTTLNARANQAYEAMEAELAQDDCAAWFISERDAWEDGWETGHKTARAEVAEEIANEIERCALVLATENDESGNYLVAAVLKKAADIARTTAEIGGGDR